jgi:hypothetical protein
MEWYRRPALLLCSAMIVVACGRCLAQVADSTHGSSTDTLRMPAAPRPDFAGIEAPVLVDKKPKLFFGSGTLHLFLPGEYNIDIQLFQVDGQLLLKLLSGTLSPDERQYFIKDMLRISGMCVISIKYGSGP